MIRFDTETLMCRFDTDSYYHIMPVVNHAQGVQRSGKSQEIPYQAKVRELSGNFVMGQGKLKMLWKVREKSGNFERVMAMVVSWVIWNISDNILIHCWWSCWHQWLGCQTPMIHWIFHWCQISFVILFAKLCLNSYGTRVNQYCESNVTRGQGKQKMFREKSGKSQEVLSGAIAGHPNATWPQSLATVFIIILVFTSSRPLPCINKRCKHENDNKNSGKRLWLTWTVWGCFGDRYH